LAILISYGASRASGRNSYAGRGRDEYLHVIDVVIRDFEDAQAPDGAIIDAYTGRERYYSTRDTSLGDGTGCTSGWLRRVISGGVR
jgi:hypothetical protein